MELEILEWVLLSAVTVNIVVTIYIARRDDLDKAQKIAQIFIVWLVPFLAAVGIWMFHRGNDNLPAIKREFGGGPQSTISSIDASLASGRSSSND